MTKRKFYTIKTILFVLSVVSIYYFVLFIKENGIKILEEPVPLIITSVSSFLILLLLLIGVSIFYLVLFPFCLYFYLVTPLNVFFPSPYSL